MKISDFTDNELKTIIYGMVTLWELHNIEEKRLNLKLLTDKDFNKLLDIFRLELRNRGQLESKEEKENLK